MPLSKNKINPYRRKLRFSSDKRKMRLAVLNPQPPKAARLEQLSQNQNGCERGKKALSLKLNERM